MNNKKNHENALVSEMLHCLEKLQEARDSVQDSEKKQQFSEAIDSLQSSLNSLASAKDIKANVSRGMGKSASTSGADAYEDDYDES